MHRRANTDERPPPTYQDALIQGVLTRSGTTPFPEAPRLNPRALVTPAPEHPRTFTESNKPKKSSPHKPSHHGTSEVPAPTADHRYYKRGSTSSGWQSDTSHVRSSKPIPPVLKKAVVVNAPQPPSASKECRILPLLAYHPSRPLLLLDFSQPLSRIKIAGDIPMRVRDCDLDQIATSPITTSLHITINSFSWSVHVHNKSGITNRNILDKLSSSLYTGISHQEWDHVKQPYRDRVKQAFNDRCRQSDRLEAVERRNGLRRVDLLCESVIWKGLSRHPEQDDVWVLTLSRQ